MRWARISLCARWRQSSALSRRHHRPPGSPRGRSTPRADYGRCTAPPPGPPSRSPPRRRGSARPPPGSRSPAQAGADTGPLGDLHVEVDLLQPDQRRDRAGASHQRRARQGRARRTSTRPSPPPPSGRVAATCATVLPEDSARPPTTAPPNTVACPAGSPTVILGCTPDEGTAAASTRSRWRLYRQGTGAPLARFTTFLTYQEPGISASDGPAAHSGSAWSCPSRRHLSPTRVARRPLLWNGRGA